MSQKIFISSLGQDSHRFVDTLAAAKSADFKQSCLMGGVKISDMPAFDANSDGDVILHAICNAISGLTGKTVLGSRADELCAQGIVDSRAYIELALEDLAEDPRHLELLHLSISLEGLRPLISPWQEEICRSVAHLLKLKPEQVCLTATSGEGLSSFGKGEGVNCLCLLSASAEV